MALLLATLRLGTPLIFAALGGVLSERAGVIALGLEGMMLAGAFAAVAGAQIGGSLLGLLFGILAGAIVGLLHAWMTQSLCVPGVLSGIALNLGIAGLTTYGVRLRSEGWVTTSSLPDTVLTLVGGILACLLWFVLYRTPLGLRLRSCGENPNAALSAGLAVGKLRWCTVMVCGALAGLGGVTLSLTGLGAFTENMTAGRGYIALAAVIFGRWNPAFAALAALLFGFGDALQMTLQTAGVSAWIPADLLDLLPYLLTLFLLALRQGNNGVPAAL
jgi:ABC-type uncharacterized transport system permease subunit